MMLGTAPAAASARGLFHARETLMPVWTILMLSLVAALLPVAAPARMLRNLAELITTLAPCSVIPGKGSPEPCRRAGAEDDRGSIQTDSGEALEPGGKAPRRLWSEMIGARSGLAARRP